MLLDCGVVVVMVVTTVMIGMVNSAGSAGSGVSCCENISIDGAGWVEVEIEKMVML